MRENMRQFSCCEFWKAWRLQDSITGVFPRGLRFQNQRIEPTSPTERFPRLYLFDFVNFDSGWIILMAWRSDIIAFELRHQDVGLGTKACRNPAQLFVVVSIFLLENDGEFIASDVDPLACRIKSHIVGHFGNRQSGDDLAGFRIQNDETWRFAA